MALFSRKKNTESAAALKPAVKKSAAVSRVPVKSGKAVHTGDVIILKSPRITEKVTMLSEKNIYTFNVAPSATKQSVASAVFAAYKVTPEKIRIVTIPRKAVFVRGKRGFSSGGKKAYVYLAKGDTISIS